jgi:hypothetical protein
LENLDDEKAFWFRCDFGEFDCRPIFGWGNFDSGTAVPLRMLCRVRLR